MIARTARTLRGVLLGAAVALLSACPPPAPPPGAVFARFGPPAPRAEVVGVAPAADYVWVGGYYRWDGSAYFWVPGRWQPAARPHAKWKPGYWKESKSGWYWVPGKWK